MKKTFIILMSLLFCLSQQIFADNDKVKIPGNPNWEITNDRDLNVPQLYQDDTHVYVYTEKQLDVILEKNGIKTEQKLFVKNEE